MEKSINEMAELYASSMQNENVTDDELYVSDMDIYISVATWQLLYSNHMITKVQRSVGNY